ncbi:TPA: Pyruvate decarboxylase 3 [Trebouxia sp. C0005]
MGEQRTLGQHLASRLVELGVQDFFAVPGDYNLVLLDQLLKEPKLNMINACNELNAGYAADGYARARGVGCVCVTFTVGGLSVINAIAGAYSENLPVICIAGGPNSNDFGTNRILHHTIGEPDFHQEMRAFKEVTCMQTQIVHLEDAHSLLDAAVAAAMRNSKPVYISVCCNLAGEVHPSFAGDPVPFGLAPKVTNERSLDAAVKYASEFMNKAVKPVMVGGVKMRWPGKAQDAFIHLSEAGQYPVAMQPSAKGFFPENHKRFLGTYWGQVSSPYCSEVVESCDVYMFVGAIHNDYSSVGYSLLLKKEKMIDVDLFRVTIGGRHTFGCVNMRDFLNAMAKAVKPNSTAWDNFQRMYVPAAEVPQSAPNSPLRTNVLFKHMQQMLSADTAVLVETGDSWFNGQKMKLPEGCLYEFQMQFGSIGWSVGATLGYAQALKGKKRVIASIGDGSFQVTAQDVSTMIRYRLNPVIFLINNGGYTIEVEIHDGPYNTIQNWDYAGLVQCFDNHQGNVFSTKARTEEQLKEAIEQAHKNDDKLCFIECFTHRDDCSKELLEWGSRVASANGRPPNPQ